MVYKPTDNWGGAPPCSYEDWYIIGISWRMGYNGILSSETLRIVVLKIYKVPGHT